MKVEDRAAAIAASEWESAFAALSSVDPTQPLGPDDLEALGEAAWWTGRVPECIAERFQIVRA